LSSTFGESHVEEFPEAADMRPQRGLMPF